MVLGVIAQAGIDCPNSHFCDEAEHPVLSKTIELPTGCIAFDPVMKTYGPPVAAAAVTKKSKAGSSAAALSDRRFDRLTITLVVVASTFTFL